MSGIKAKLNRIEKLLGERRKTRKVVHIIIGKDEEATDRETAEVKAEWFKKHGTTEGLAFIRMIGKLK